MATVLIRSSDSEACAAALGAKVRSCAEAGAAAGASVGSLPVGPLVVAAGPRILSARHPANWPVSLAAMSAMTPRPNCACLPVISSEVTTLTCVTAPCSDIVTSTVADAVPLPRVSRPLRFEDHAVGGLVLRDEPGRPRVASGDRPDLDPHPAGDLIAIHPVDGRPGHARRDPLHVEQGFPHLRHRRGNRELVLQLHATHLVTRRGIWHTRPGTRGPDARLYSCCCQHCAPGQDPGEVLPGSRPAR